jgi:acetylornithine/succinyldiaminopimelate/putrescine aminotransferase
VACSAGLALLKEIRTPKIEANVGKAAEILMQGLKELQAAHPDMIKAVRGRGLMIGIQVAGPAKPKVLACLERGLIVNGTADTVIRLLPPLNVSPAEATQGLAILKSVLGDAAAKASPPTGSTPKRKKP